MSSLVLIPWAETVWSAAGRIATRTPLPLTHAGQNQARTWADSMASSGLSVVYSSNERTSVETARIVADRTGAPHKTIPELSEVGAGLWDGLTTEELRRRYSKIFKKWCDDPSSVCPPEGEDVEDAFERLQQPLERLTRKQGDRCMAVVLGPLAFALARCWIESVELAKTRSMRHHEPLTYQLVGREQ